MSVEISAYMYFKTKGFYNKCFKLITKILDWLKYFSSKAYKTSFYVELDHKEKWHDKKRSTVTITMQIPCFLTL